MALLEHYYTRFEEERIYHIYNRSVDRKPLFKNSQNYAFFMKKYLEYLFPVLETYCYSLSRDHFNFLVKVKDLTTFKKLSNLPENKTAHEIVSHHFRKFFQSYSMAFNKQHNRIGTLFQTPFKRVLIDDHAFLRKVVFYIHANPQFHELIDDFQDWKWSSYYPIFHNLSHKLNDEEMFEWFGSKDKFIQLHQETFRLKANFNESYFCQAD